MKDYDKWFKNTFPDLYECCLHNDYLALRYKKAIHKAWKHQQKKIDVLEKKLKCGLDGANK